MTLYKAKRKPSYNDCNAPKEICRCEGGKLNQRYVKSEKKLIVQVKKIQFEINWRNLQTGGDEPAGLQIRARVEYRRSSKTHISNINCLCGTCQAKLDNLVHNFQLTF